MNLQQLLAVGSAAASAQILERDIRNVSAKFLEDAIKFLTSTPGVKRGATSFGKRGTTNEQIVAQFVFPQSLLAQDGAAGLAKIVAWKQNQESVLCQELDLDVKIVKVRHVKDENDQNVDHIELLMGAIQQDKGLQEVAVPDSTKKTK